LILLKDEESPPWPIVIFVYDGISVRPNERFDFLKNFLGIGFRQLHVLIF
jgi:hypothetical protein